MTAFLRRLPLLRCLPALALAGCAASAPPAAVEPALPAQWQAPLPHRGSLTDLSQWWRAQGDPLLVELIAAAQAQSPTVASAASRLAQARATRLAAGAALGPRVDGNISAVREPVETVVVPNMPPPDLIATTVSGAAQASWEIDLFGGNRAARDAAQARLEGAEAGWHDARVSVAAEVANQYIGQRACRRLVALAQADAESRTESARLADLSAGAGFQAPADAALARAAAADARGRLSQRRAACDTDLKALVALTGLAEPDLSKKLADVSAGVEEFAPIKIANLPAEVLTQRPDLAAAAREVAAASADMGQAHARRYPRLTLNGSVGFVRYRGGGVGFDSGTWSVGPLALTVPLYDGGQADAAVATAQARYDEAAALYRARARQAVREVEEALVNLDSTAQRREEARVAVEGYRAALAGAEARHRRGLASRLDVEDARRSALNADVAQVNLQRERLAAWVALYRAAGGGWQPAPRDISPPP